MTPQLALRKKQLFVIDEIWHDNRSKDCSRKLRIQLNLDGSVDLLDVAPFVEFLSNCDFQSEADINQDGAADLLEVAPFCGLLTGGQKTPVKST